jgi:acetyl esterase/lipase
VAPVSNELTSGSATECRLALERAAKIRALGPKIGPELSAATCALFAPLHTAETRRGAVANRDIPYGSAPRHRLDIYRPAAGESTANPVLVFVHGGGFVGGDKSIPGGAFYDNIGFWAARNGLLGVTINYRLAPQFGWPAGSEDVGSALQWVCENINAYGGDPQRVVLMGQSAGAVHVAGYVAQYSSAPTQCHLAGAILISGLYDTRTMQKNRLFEAYFGKDAAAAQTRSFLSPLAKSNVPLMLVTAELDPPDFQRQAAELLHAYVSHHQRLPRFVQLTAHNHFSPVLGLNAPADRLGPHLLEFIQENQ